MMQHEMESQIHDLEKIAYSSVLRSFKAQSDSLTWEKEELITELRKELRVSHDEHRDILSKVNTDELIMSIREWRTTRRARINIPPSIHDPISLSPTVSASRYRPKISLAPALPTQPFPGLGGGIQTPKPSPGYPLMGRTPRGMLSNHGSSAITLPNDAAAVVDLGNYSVGMELRIRWPNDNHFYEALIFAYNPVRDEHLLLYNKNTSQESSKWVNLKEIPPEDIQWIGVDPAYRQVSHGGFRRDRANSKEQSGGGFLLSRNGNLKSSDEIEILDTDTLIKEVEKVFDATYPDLDETEKANKMLKDHERALIDIIAKLDDVSDSDGGGDH